MGELYLCQYPGCDTILQFWKILTEGNCEKGNTNRPFPYYFFVCVWGGGTGGWTEGFTLARQVFITFFFFCGAGAWTQGFHLELVHQPYFCDGSFRDRVLQTICLGWLWTTILLISAFWVARIQNTCMRPGSVLDSRKTRRSSCEMSHSKVTEATAEEL
jgi:hypothetical protein